MKYIWKILELKTVGDDLIARYHASLIGDVTVETEGYWKFQEPKSLDGINEETVGQWIEEESSKDGVSSIKSRLLEQFNEIESHKNIALPWRPATFTINL